MQTQENPQFPPAPERLLSMMVDSLQMLSAKAHGLHIAPPPPRLIMEHGTAAISEHAVETIQRKEAA